MMLSAQVPVDTADVMVDDFVVTDSLEVIEPKPIELVPGFEKVRNIQCYVLHALNT